MEPAFHRVSFARKICCRKNTRKALAHKGFGDFINRLSERLGGAVHCHKVLSEDRLEVRLYCYSPERKQKENAMAGRFCDRFETALNPGKAEPWMGSAGSETYT